MKLAKLTLLFLVAFSLSLLSAKGWEVDSDILINLTQGIYSDNWSGSEQSTVTWVAQSNTTAQKQMKEWLNNKNTLKLAFGQTHQEKGDIDGDGEVEWGSGQKSTDKIDFESLFRFTLKSFVDPYMALRMESQFVDESGAKKYYVNPMLFTESAGIMKSIINADKTKLSLRLGAAIRENVDRKLDVTPVDGGAEAVAEFKKIFGDAAASYNSRLSVYQAIFNSEKDPNGYWKETDYRWENMLSTKLFGLLSANLSFDIVYDRDKQVNNKVQWKEILGLGFSYSLF